MRKPSIIAILGISVMLVPALSHGADTTPIETLKAGYARPSSVPYPVDNPYSADKAALGERLFFDVRLSGDNRIACASCHDPLLSWSDGLSRGLGHVGIVLARRTPTILNAAWIAPLMWDGRKEQLEDQALVPMAGATEMNQDVDRLAAKLAAIRSYDQAFELSFPGEGLTLQTVAKALATYERTIVSPVTPFDRWVAGDETAISESAKRGFVLFNTTANCAACHSGWNFTDNGFHDIGLPDDDLGRAEILGLPSMEHAFKTPTLRDVSRRGPYMHDGSLPTLSAVMDHYRKGGLQRPSLSDDMRPLDLDAGAERDLIEFLTTLTDAPPAATAALGSPAIPR
jgi:cytochrome c peroxidase